MFTFNFEEKFDDNKNADSPVDLTNKLQALKDRRATAAADQEFEECISLNEEIAELEAKITGNQAPNHEPRSSPSERLERVKSAPYLRTSHGSRSAPGSPKARDSPLRRLDLSNSPHTPQSSTKVAPNSYSPRRSRTPISRTGSLRSKSVGVKDGYNKLMKKKKSRSARRKTKIRNDRPHLNSIPFVDVLTPGSSFEAYKTQVGDGLNQLGKLKMFAEQYSKIEEEYSSKISDLVNKYTNEFTQNEAVQEYDLVKASIKVFNMVNDVGQKHKNCAVELGDLSKSVKLACDEVARRKRDLEQDEMDQTRQMYREKRKFEKSTERCEKLIDSLLRKKAQLQSFECDDPENIHLTFRNIMDEPVFSWGRSRGKSLNVKIQKAREVAMNRRAETYEACRKHSKTVREYNDMQISYTKGFIPNVIKDLEKVEKMRCDYTIDFIHKIGSIQQSFAESLLSVSNLFKLTLVDRGIDASADIHRVRNFCDSFKRVTAKPAEYNLSKTVEQILDLTYELSGVPKFDDVFGNKMLQSHFVAFLESIYCTENMEFYQAVNSYEDAHDLLSRESIAQHINDIFIAPDAPKMINIPSEDVEEIRRSFENLDPDLFESSKHQVYRLMREDSYPKFLKSKFFARYQESKRE